MKTGSKGNGKIISMSFTKDQYKRLLTQLPKDVTLGKWLKAQILKLVLTKNK